MLDAVHKVHGKKFVLFGGSVERINTIERMLFFAGAAVEATTSAQKGLLNTRNARPDMLIIDDSELDVAMKDIAQAIQSDPLISGTPLIIIVSPEKQAEYDVLFKSQIHEYVSHKNFDLIQVVSKIESILDKMKPEEVEVFDFTESTAAHKAPAESTLKLLVVEDDPLLRNLLSMRLHKSAIAHEFCHSGNEATSHVLHYKPTVIILDLMLPGKSGMEILADLRADTETKDIPVIIFSNKDDDTERTAAKALGAEDFMVKAMTDLGALISRIIELGTTR